MTSRPKKTSPDLEAQLAGVLEQDGVTMASPEGVRRRARRPKKTLPTPLASVRIFDPAPSVSTHDPVAEWDSSSVDVMVRASESAKERTISIKRQEHARSSYVVSLRGLLIGSALHAQDDRLSVVRALESPSPTMIRAHAVDVYGTLTQDLAIDGYDPHALAEQFTPNDFFSAYREVYGKWRRIGSVMASLNADLLSIFQRVERVERQIQDEVEDTLSVIEEVPRFSFARSLAGFAALSLVITLPANAVAIYRTATDRRAAIETAGSQGVQAALAAKNAGSLPDSIDALKQASTQFREADAVLSQSNALALGLASIVPQQYRSARALLEVGDKSAEAGKLLATAFEKFFSDPGRSLDERLDVLAAYARGALPLLADASQAASTVDMKTLPDDKRQTFQTLAPKLNQATQSVQELAGMADLLSAIVGKDQERTYLFIFQNNTELRPTGGFMGSIAEVTMDRGAIKSMVVPQGGTYDLKGQLLAHVQAPKPLQLINPEWQFQDANWSPDFPTAADKIRWFWSKSGQPTMDGIVALNATVVQKMLDITGPIDLPAYGKTIDSSNFMRETQEEVEVDYDHAANTPKKFVGDLAQVMLERMKTFSREDWLKIAALVSQSLQNKDIQINLSRADEQASIIQYGWAGNMKETTGDSLALIEANIAGQKTDGVIAEKAIVNADVQADGSVIDTVTLNRTHQGTKGDAFSGVRNVSYLRAYVPKGSQLLSASGFETPAENLFKKPDVIDVPDQDLLKSEETMRSAGNDVEAGEDGSHTVFGGWMQLDPGQAQTITLRYRLPFTVQDLHAGLQAGSSDAQQANRGAYLLLLTSQSGKSTRQVTANLTLPDAWSVDWQNGNATQTSMGLTLQNVWDHDLVMASLLTPSSQVSSP